MTGEPGAALVTGGNRGIGLEVCRGLGRLGRRVIVAGRDPAAVDEAVEELRHEKIDAAGAMMDVASRESVTEAAERLFAEGARIDVLVNNAGVYPTGEVLTIGEETMRRAFDVNLLGPIWTCQAFVPPMQLRRYGRVVNVSSQLGAFAGGIAGAAAYGVSKAALNALTVKLASEVRGDVKVNAACPGWVRTRMGGPTAPVSARQAAEGVVWLATLPADGPNGGFFRDGQPIPW